VGVSSGPAWVGVVGDEKRIDITALGDNVNVAARLGGAAKAGELLVTADAASAAGLDPSLERRSLDLKGKSTATEVVTMTVAPGGAVRI
jgi:adenylate cyclase